MSGPRILLIVGGGIAAYKSCELVRLIRRAGGEVTCVLTEGGSKFVTPMTLAALSENPVHTSLWDLRNEVEMGHIQLSRWADLVVVCPATADLMAKMAGGIADDLATTLLLATDKPVLVAPAMNVRMWEHAATRRNVQTLRDSAVTVIDPDEGAMACGEYGAGRLPEPHKIFHEIAAALVGVFEMPEGIPAAADFDVVEEEAVIVDPLGELRALAEGAEDTEDGDAADAGAVPPGAMGRLGGLISGLIKRSPERAMPLEHDEIEALIGDLEPPADLAEVPAPSIDLDSPLLSRKGKAKAAPPTDPDAINHVVKADPGFAPQPFEEELPAGKAGKGKKGAAAEGDLAGELAADPLAGQPDFAPDDADELPADGPLSGRHVLVTAGPTHEAIDPVRYIANRSSGKQGFAIAAAAARAGARVTLVAGPVSLPTPRGVDRIDVESARDMAEAVKRSLPADVAVMVAAVADWRPAQVSGEKIKKRGSAPPALALIENPDILASLASNDRRPGLVVGFAAETEEVIENAKDKRRRKGADWIVANDVSGGVMGGEVNAVHIVSSKGIESLPEMAKDAVAGALIERIADFVNTAPAKSAK